MPEDNIIELAPQFTGDDVTHTFGCDHVVAQIVVAKYEDGKKVGEIPFNAIKLFYPFPLKEAIEQAINAATDADGAGQ